MEGINRFKFNRILRVGLCSTFFSGCCYKPRLNLFVAGGFTKDVDLRLKILSLMVSKDPKGQYFGGNGSGSEVMALVLPKIYQGSLHFLATGAWRCPHVRTVRRFPPQLLMLHTLSICLNNPVDNYENWCWVWYREMLHSCPSPSASKIINIKSSWGS